MSDENETPTSDEWLQAKSILEQSLRRASFGQLGGFRPDYKGDRYRSWWGGNFLGQPGENIPTCSTTGRKMTPVLQIRLDELTFCPAVLQDFSIINLWLDLDSDELRETKNGQGFCLRTYTSVDGLIPVGPGYRENSDLPTFPISWQVIEGDKPSWEDFADKIPERVACSDEDEWFFGDTEVDREGDTAPIKVGGWPSWIQGSQWPDNGTFALQINSSQKGQLALGDAGSVYLFSTPSGWQMFGDCY